TKPWEDLRRDLSASRHPRDRQSGEVIDPMITRYLNDLASLFFPDTCAGCDTPLVYGERLICTSCWYQLPVTLSADKLHMLGTGPSASLFLLTEPSRIQRIIHRMKYRNRPELAIL